MTTRTSLAEDYINRYYELRDLAVDVCRDYLDRAINAPTPEERSVWLLAAASLSSRLEFPHLLRMTHDIARSYKVSLPTTNEEKKQ